MAIGSGLMRNERPPLAQESAVQRDERSGMVEQVPNDSGENPATELGCSRRGFARKVLLAGGLGWTAGAISENWPESTAGAASSAAAPDGAAQGPSPIQEALIVAALVQRYPSEHLDEATINQILLDVRVDIARGRQLHSFPLPIDVEPAPTFSPLLPGEAAVPVATRHLLSRSTPLLAAGSP
jgi:hypothetical protein